MAHIGFFFHKHCLVIPKAPDYMVISSLVTCLRTKRTAKPKDIPKASLIKAAFERERPTLLKQVPPITKLSAAAAKAPIKTNLVPSQAPMCTISSTKATIAGKQCAHLSHCYDFFCVGAHPPSRPALCSASLASPPVPCKTDDCPKLHRLGMGPNRGVLASSPPCDFFDTCTSFYCTKSHGPSRRLTCWDPACASAKCGRAHDLRKMHANRDVLLRGGPAAEAAIAEAKARVRAEQVLY